MTDREVPSNVWAEQALLGAVFKNNDAFQTVSAFLKTEHFYEAVHQTLFDLVATLISQGKSATPVSLAPFLDKMAKVGDGEDAPTLWAYVARIASNAVTVINARDMGMAIVDAAERRQIVTIADEAKDAAMAPTPDKPAVMIAGEMESKLADLRSESPKGATQGSAKAVVARLNERATANYTAPTIPLPLDQLREVLSGEFEAGNLYGLLSSSGEGKTSLALQIVHHAARNGHPTLLLSYDQSAEQSIDQIASQIAGIEMGRIKKKDLLEKEWERYFDALRKLSDMPIVVEHCNREGTAQLGNHARRFIKRYGGAKPTLVVLDHVRRVMPKDAKAHEGRIASEINSACKAYAGELGCAWLNLNQRSSFGMKRDNPAPISSDIFGGEQAKEDYDAMLYLYRPAKYQEDQIRTARNDKDRQAITDRFSKYGMDEAEIGALKVRYGDSLIRRRIRFEKEFTRYVSMRTVEEETLLQGVAY